MFLEKALRRERAMAADIRLASGLALRDGRVLLVASTYRSHAQLWNLPGGRVAPGELLAQTVVREVREETGLTAVVSELAYISESYDGDVHVASATFAIDVTGTLATPGKGDHVLGAQWVPIDRLAERITIAVVRDPLVQYLRERKRYFGFAQAGVSIEWPDQ
jgi:ADP-ribose pyrophosphatase YjhB (NUDIX family)